MRFLLIVPLTVVFSLSGYSLDFRSDTCWTREIFLRGPNVSIYTEYHGTLPDTFNIKCVDGGTLIVINYSCKGRSSIKKIHKRGFLEFEGSYVDPPGELGKYDTIFEMIPPDGLRYIAIRKYYEPLRDGVWSYYNRKGKLVRKEEFIGGIPVK